MGSEEQSDYAWDLFDEWGYGFSIIGEARKVEKLMVPEVLEVLFKILLN